ncbi:McrB family protein [Chryseobacterium gallinarum]|uniref:AAA domain-containing protein n=1 Tax=Chryseobacterium gallinarum TaxID=1324352 RepID=A0ABX6KNS1_CHRGL|nr:AAA family ATPase [Chryseobacterium gallinarum]QIY89408.1 AAA domain-containing protein [Chryseobacterium gallinarum]
MKYLSKSTVFESWKSIIEQGETSRASLNKFFGILEILKHLNIEIANSVESNYQYNVFSSELSNSLQDKFFFDESNKKAFASQDTLNIIFPNYWASNAFQILLRNNQLPLKNIACICLQNEEFEDEFSEQDVIDTFINIYHLTDVVNIFFTTESDMNIEFSSSVLNRNSLFSDLKNHFSITDNSKFTLGFDRTLITANPGELTRGPFIQPLYSGQENLKCLLIANFNITEYYEIGRAENSIADIFSSEVPLSHQVIFYGSPGTGKSREIEIRTNGHDRTRTTFHPETDYYSFVGSYKPVMDGINIKYDFVPQAFTKAYCNAWLNPERPYFLIIEEINRGNCAQIFGDLFQCLDRDDNGFSKYEINCDKDLANYLKFIFENSTNTEAVENYKAKIQTEDFDKIILPNNLFILATMNTSDQSLFPMDSAFKRRWDWEFVPINYEDANSLKILVGDSIYNWGKFIECINPKIKELTGSEDKQLGNRFVSPKDGKITFDQFRSKVLFYLWSEVYKDEFRTQSSIFKYELEENNPIDFQFGELYNDNTADIVKAFLKFNGMEPEQ